MKHPRFLFTTIMAMAVPASASFAQDSVMVDRTSDGVQSLVAAWGPCDGDCPWDLNGDGTVDGEDMVLLIAGNPSLTASGLDAEGRTIVDLDNFIPPIFINTNWSSGVHSLPRDEPATVVATSTFTASGTDWVRVRFSDFDLGNRSRVTLTSLLDGQSQTFTQRTLKAWQGYSAFFNGADLKVELEVGPGDSGVFVEVGETIGGYETTDGPLATLCGADNRVNSTDSRVGRMRLNATTAQCTIWLVSNGAALTAGHCVDFGGGDGTMDLPAGTVIEFDIPDSSTCGVTNASAPEDQFPIVLASIDWSDTGNVIGGDWAVMDVGPNANGLDPHRARGFFRMTREAPAASSTIRITGCGDDSTPTGACGGLNSDSRTLQTDTGPYVGEFNSGNLFWHRYSTDTTNSSSGSPIIWNANGVTMGIHTNAGCTATGGSNQGCSFEHQPLENSLEEFPPGASAANTVFLDIGWPDLAAEDGTVLRPYDTLSAAVAAVPSGGLLSVVEGTYTAGAAITITTGMTIDAPVGTVTFQ